MRLSSIAFALVVILTGCGRFSNKDQKKENEKRIVCLSKQYNEIIFELNAQQDLVAVDLSSTYPPEIKKLPTVGYHRALSTEGILSMKPTMIIHDNNVGPEQVMRQMEGLKIPMMVFKTKGVDIESAKALVTEMGQYFGRQKAADSLNAKLDKDMRLATEALARYDETPKVVVIHYGRAGNLYLTMTEKSTTGELVRMAGGTIPIPGDRGMMQLSAEVIAKSDPDVILLTDFGYDRLGSPEQIKSLPGVAGTRAAANNRIYRVEEHDMVYFGPRTGEVVLMLQELIHRNGKTQ
ncbi:MAG: ABC transporter substrate-binding protein [Cyclobacteriaceae bacterium]|nr:ABC transporter substrate-binding protein [Cyclobacteriaceae bacterium]MCB0499322.1 ABC transporter substrate-binding protein [Cyclobacteriaceae bacterium]MCB9236400.1 ABC transporter substrate-binding protein [Flammeovirgaceae bacterium]MCO5272281.1 ABC transporter substrate-binding protein [Cyclobacteriaceae bacterium]MCW5902139.1 ABC transporter substrate-binding protein [Cyclobacteriaceae bacterium]